MGVAVETKGVGGGLTQLAKALLALDVVGVGRDQQAPGLQLDSVAGAESKRSPLYENGKEDFLSQRELD